MGFLHSGGMSSVFIDYLTNVGPVSIREICDKFYTCHPVHMGMDAKDIKAHKEHAEEALALAVLEYLRLGLIEEVGWATSINGSQVIFYLTWNKGMSEEEAHQFLERVNWQEYAALLVESYVADVDGNWIWFNPLVWQLSAYAKENPDRLGPFEGEDL